jgi:predicted nucleic acid-binding protein
MKVFFDTNIIAYQFDKDDPTKQKKSIALIRQHMNKTTATISSQVVQEFINVALTKFKTTMSFEEIKIVKSSLLDRLCKQYPTLEFYDRALSLYVANSLNHYDSLVIQAAIDLGCDILYSEDLQDGQLFGKLRIVNPFK